MLIKFDNKMLPKDTRLNHNNLECKHISYMNLYKKVNPKAAICSNSEIQFMVAALYCYNDSSLRFQYTPPANLSNIEILMLPTVQSLTSIFSDVTILTEGKTILQFYLQGLTNECEISFINLLETQGIDKSIQSCLKKKSNLMAPEVPLLTFELVNNNRFLDIMEVCSIILSNNFFSFLLTQCIRNNMCLAIPLRGWHKEEIDRSEYLIMLNYIFKNVWFCGYGNKWVSDFLIVFQPFEHLVTQFSQLDRSGFSSNTSLKE